MKVKLTLTEEMLGTKPMNPDVFGDWIASKNPSGTASADELENARKTQEELETAPKKEEAGTTVFHRQDGVVGIYNYQIKGFLKEACSCTNRFDKELRDGLEKLAAYRSKIDGSIFVFPRFIPVIIAQGGKMDVCERPLRAETAQGPRVTLARSETIPAGSTLEFEIKIFSKDLIPYVRMWLGYGALKGLGQWRNSSKGCFTWEEVQV